MLSAGVAAHTKQENFGADPFSPGILNILDLYEKSPRGYFVRPTCIQSALFLKVSQPDFNTANFLNLMAPF